MDELIQNFSTLMLEWGFWGMFISAFIAGSILPMSSEFVMVGLLKLGLSPMTLIVSATIGNTLGSMTCFGMGHLGKLEWIEKYLHIKRRRIERMQKYLQCKGAVMAFFSFVPIVGGVIVVTLGLMRSNVYVATISMLVGKVVRYFIVYYTFQQAVAMLAV